MLDVDALLRETDQRLAALPDARAADLRALRRDLSRRVAAAPPREVVALALRLVQAGGFARRFLAYELLNQHRAALASLDAADVERLATASTPGPPSTPSAASSPGPPGASINWTTPSWPAGRPRRPLVAAHRARQHRRPELPGPRRPGDTPAPSPSAACSSPTATTWW